MDDPEAVAAGLPVATGAHPILEVPHPWSAILARYGSAAPRGCTFEAHVVRWRTSRGEQPVLLVIRRRRD